MTTPSRQGEERTMSNEEVAPETRGVTVQELSNG